MSLVCAITSGYTWLYNKALQISVSPIPCHNFLGSAFVEAFEALLCRGPADIIMDNMLIELKCVTCIETFNG